MASNAYTFKNEYCTLKCLGVVYYVLVLYGLREQLIRFLQNGYNVKCIAYSTMIYSNVRVQYFETLGTSKSTEFSEIFVSFENILNRNKSNLTFFSKRRGLHDQTFHFITV